MSFRSIFASLALGFIACATHAAIVINGVTTESYYGTSVTFTVPNEAGYVIASQLDGLPINASNGYTATGAGYHELFVTKTPSAGGAAETRLVQFIINARAGADTGLANWVPLEAVDAPADALATTGVDFYLPRRVPAGMPFPLVARLTRQDDTIAKLNATAVARSPQGRAVTWRVFRGAGAGNWNVPTSSGPLDLTLQIGDRTFVRTVDIVAAPSWQALTGNVVGAQTFGPNQFVSISGDVTVPAGATLRFEAGTVVRVTPQATIDVQGALIIAGTTDEPVFFTRFDPAEPWGGFWIRGTAATADIRGAFFTGGGADQGWIGSHGYSSHKPEQPVIACDNSTVTLTDTWIVDNAEGQGLHGNRALVTLTRCLVQRTKSCGQFNNGRLRVFDSHVVEIPAADYVFADDDNDGIYITGAPADPLLPHELRNSVIGWAKDDGIDAGSGSAGLVDVSDCWIESCFHEGMAWSETRTVRVTNTVTINNGQGIEAGFGSPAVTATGLLAVGNLVGARFGDNYDWDYFGSLNVQNSLLLHNGRDVWGFEWDSWDYRTDRMTIANNAVTAALALHPNNSVFNPASQESQIAAFLAVPETRRGFALARRSGQNPRNGFGGELTVHLDRPATSPIALPWRIIGKRELNSDSDVVLATGTIAFSAGMNAAVLTIPALPSAANFGWIAILLDDAANAVATGVRGCHFVDLPQPSVPSPISLVPFGARWRYLDDGSNQGTAWRAEGFDDAAWRSGLAELGYGDDDEEQRVEDNPTPGYNSADSNRYATTYFRGTFEVSDPAAYANLALAVRYDDGAIVYINGQRVAATSNMPAGEAAFNFYTGGSTPPDNSVLTATLPTTALHSGTNTIAVEIHQQAADSSDISFDLQLLAAPPPVARSILARAGTLQGALYLFWTTADALPQQSADLTTWSDRPELTSPIEIVPAEKRGFFRLVLP